MFANFTAYPFKKALGIIFQVLKTLLNIQSSIGHWVEIKGRETIFFLINTLEFSKWSLFYSFLGMIIKYHCIILCLRVFESTYELFWAAFSLMDIEEEETT